MAIWKDNRFQIAILTVLGLTLVVSLYEEIVLHYTPKRTHSVQIAYLFQSIWEGAFFGFGVGFFFIYSKAISRLDSGPIRTRCIGIWLAISYYFISWWPHSAGHQFLSMAEPTHYIILEVCFHWPNLIAALVLCYYQFDILLIAYNVALNNKQLRFWSDDDTKPIPFYKNRLYHAILISIAASTGWILFSWYVNKYPSTIEQWQKAIIITIYIANGCTSGVGMGFLYHAGYLSYRLPKKRTRFISIVSVLSIAFLLMLITPHPVVHRITSKSQEHTVITEYTFHTAMTVAICVLAFYQHRFLVLALEGRMSMLIKFQSKQMEHEAISASADNELKIISTLAETHSTSEISFDSPELTNGVSSRMVESR